MAYDAATHQLVLFAVGNLNSTWAWNGSSWTQVDDSTDPGCTSACTDSPPGRNTFGMAYDGATRTLVIFGGNAYNDTWAWNGSSWSQVDDSTDPGCTSTCTDSPPATLGTEMAYDATTKQVVLFGGGGYTNFNDTWALSHEGGSYSWTQVDDTADPGCTASCTSSPPSRNVAALAYDPATSQLVLYGGEATAGQANGLSDTWLWSSTSWQQVDDHDGTYAGCGESLPVQDRCPSSPAGRVGAAVAYDPTIGRLVLFGGMNDYGRPEFDDTWVWNGRAWQQVDEATDPYCTSSCTGSPPARDAFALADDAATDQLLVFGGDGLNDTWAAPATPTVPSVPTHLRTQTNGDRVTVRWSAPAMAGPPITAYRATAAPGGRSCTTTRFMHCTIVGLSVHDDYTISVRATNLVGRGPAGVLRRVRG